ncbi:MAG: AAA family ATPase [Ferrimicrobium sp.]
MVDDTAAAPGLVALRSRGVGGPKDLVVALESVDYLLDLRLATALYLALALGRPLLLEGDAGVGKTELAVAVSEWIGGELIRLQCYEGIDSHQAMYDWDYGRQLLHLKAVEVAHEAVVAGAGGLERELYSEQFLIERPLLRAIRGSDSERPPVLLIDELDRADDEFEAFLLEVLSSGTITIPELGTQRALVTPVTIVTSNRTRELHDALKRRCLYHWVDHPSLDREIAIIRRRVPEADESIARQVTQIVHALREAELYKPPGVAETIDWARALVTLEVTEISEEVFDSTLGTIVKHREDEERARTLDVSALVAGALTSRRDP